MVTGPFDRRLVAPYLFKTSILMEPNLSQITHLISISIAQVSLALEICDRVTGKKSMSDVRLLESVPPKMSSPGTESDMPGGWVIKLTIRELMIPIETLRY